VPRPTPLAMDDTHATAAVMRRFREKVAERETRLVLRHAVQVELVPHRVLAAPEPPQRSFRDALAAKRQLVPGVDIEVRRVEAEGISEHAGFVGAPGRRARVPARARGCRLRLAERPHVSHGGAEQIAILVLDVGTLRPRAGAAALTV